MSYQPGDRVVDGQGNTYDIILATPDNRKCVIGRNKKGNYAMLHVDVIRAFTCDHDNKLTVTADALGVMVYLTVECGDCGEVREFAVDWDEMTVIGSQP